jgi:hypothetical protein
VERDPAAFPPPRGETRASGRNRPNEPAEPARKAFAEGGFRKVREGLGKGMFPAVAVGVLLNQQAGGSSDEEG